MAEEKPNTNHINRILNHADPRMRAAAQRIKDGRPEIMPWDGVQIDGFTIHQDETGYCVAVPSGDLVVRARTWPTRLEGEGLPREYVPQEKLTKGQTRYLRMLFKEHKSAVLFGPPGRGKSVVALHALRDLHLAGMSVWAISFSQFTQMCKPGWADDHEETVDRVMRRLTSYAFLLIDDVGYGDSGYEPTLHDKKITLELIAARESNRRKTWITTNSSLEDLDTYGEAAISRLRADAIEVDFNKLPNFRTEASQGSMI